MRHLIVVMLLALGCSLGAATVSGNVSLPGGGAANGARVTLFTPDTWFFRETRTSAAGAYSFANVPTGDYRLGVALRRSGYQELGITVAAADVTRAFALTNDTNPGRWTIVSDTGGELLEGTGSASLSPNGEMFICHDTIDPIAFDPLSGQRWFPPGSGTPQGCHVTTLLTSGDLYYAGGSMGGLPQTQVTRVSEIYHRASNTWTRKADMQIGRWYPGIVRLADERILLIGGEGPEEGYGRTDTCEIFDPRTNTYTMTGSFDLPTEMPPALLMLDGRVMKTWRYAEFYSTSTGTWSDAPRLLQERLGAAGGDHADHEIVYLPDGRVMAVGIRPLPSNTTPRMVEFFTPGTNSWALGPNPRHVRGRPEVALLPDGTVFTFGGEYTGPSAAAPTLRNAGQVPNCTNVADLFDPVSGTWRAMADANRYVHYHNITLVLPDGRVLASGGAGPGADFGDDNSIEVFEPPYLFRGVRPRIDSVSSTSLVNGDAFSLQVSGTAAVTGVVLVGTRSATHWIDGGVQRYLSLPFTQSGGTVTATVPSSTTTALPGWYLLSVLVDDIPSEARMVRITPATASPIADLPTVTIATSGSALSEGGSGATITVTRSGGTSAPLTVALATSGSARPGFDCGVVPAFLSIPAGQAIAAFTVTPTDDSEVESSEALTISIASRVHYANGSASSVTLTIADNDSATNTAPAVSAGPDLTITLPASASLNGTVTDDGKPTGSTLTSIWSKLSGPGTVSFANASAVDTTAGFSAAGSYVLRLTASDSALSSTDDVTITIQGATNQPPTIATAAAASPSPVRGITTTLTVMGADDAGESPLTYTWANTGTPPAAVNFSANGTNAAKTTTARFAASGSYQFRVTISDAAGATVTSSVTVTVDPVLSTIAVAPATALVVISDSLSFTATGKDQFGFALVTQPSFTWTVSGGGSVSGAGVFTAGSTAGGPFTVTAASMSLTGTASVTVVSSPVTVGHWRLDEGSGTSTADSSGNGRNGTLVDALIWVDGVAGKALFFNGTSGYVAIPDFPPPTSVTISAWIKPSAASSADRIIVDKHNSEYDLRLDGAGQLSATVAGISLTDTSFTLDSVANVGRWYHVAVTFDASTDVMKLYRDGQPVASRSNIGVITDQATALRIGRHSQFDFGSFLGAIDEVRLVGTALTASEIQDQYAEGMGTLNRAPLVDAGPARTVILPGAASLDGTVSDDGLPAGSSLAIAWSQVSGPGVATFATGSLADTNVTFSTAGTYVLRLSAADSLRSTSADVTVTVQASGTLPAPWNGSTLGAASPAGSASAAGDVFTITGSGTDIWATADAGFLISQPSTSDVTVIARVRSLQNTHPWAKTGVMIRETLAANAKHAFMAITPSNGTAFQRRPNTGGSSSHTAGSRWTAPVWVKLVRNGNTFSGYESADGVSWRLVGATTITMNATVQICLPVTSHVNGVSCTAVIDNLSITPVGNG